MLQLQVCAAHRRRNTYPEHDVRLGVADDKKASSILAFLLSQQPAVIALEIESKKKDLAVAPLPLDESPFRLLSPTDPVPAEPSSSSVPKPLGDLDTQDELEADV
jgi:hypothetical protein